MKLPFDLLTQSYTKPHLFLCETDKTKICELQTIEMSGTFKFNAYNELQFSIGRTYTNIITGKTEVNPFYDKIEALRLVYLSGFGYFEIQEPEIVSDGIEEKKNVTAYGLEYSLAQKYIDGMYVNTGDNNSIEVIQGGGVSLRPIPLYDEINTNLSLLHIVLEKVYGWTIGHVDESLKTMTRTFEVDRASVYDFITQDICDKFNCFVVFDTIENKINLYAESLISKFIADGQTSKFVLSTPYSEIVSVTVGGYPTTDYTYDPGTGVLTFGTTPEKGDMIEVVDGSQDQWKTDVYVSFENLAQEAQINYSADDIKTVLTVKGADDLGIHEVNMGIPYIVDLSYYYSVDWMGQELYDAYTAYLQKCNNSQLEYKQNAESALDIKNRIYYEENRLSLGYTLAMNVVSTTVGTYYVRGGSDPNYYYTEVSLPEEFNANSTYYTLHTCNLNEDKVALLYDALNEYYMSEDEKILSGFDDLKEDFAFMSTNTIDSLLDALSVAGSLSDKDEAVNSFLDEMWEQLGRTALLSLYYSPYVKLKETNDEAGWSHPENENYMSYHVTTLFVSSIEKESAARDIIIKEYNNQYSEIQNANNKIANSVLMDVFFENYYIDKGCSDLEAKQKAMKLLVRISPFLREDEYVDDNFVETNSDTIEMILETKQALLECGRIELAKICEPKLSFSMDMANIFALREFDPIIHQFQLGNLINVVLRPDYIKRARLLSVNINFDDFSDFSCEFGELTSLKTQSSIHADLLSAALVAGKSVASNASYWSKGADLATSTYQKIQQGLLDATSGIYSSDQGVIIDKQGIKLTKVIDADTGEVSPAQAWMRNNTILLSDDGFKTAKVGLGEFTIGSRKFYGILSDAMLAGYIESSEIVGGTINIGNGTFMVDMNGVVTMKSADNVIEGYAKTDYVESKYSTLEQSIEGFKTNVGKTYSTKDEVTGLEERISSAESSITQHADEIALKVTQEQVDASVAGVQNQINDTNNNVNALKSRVTSAETSIVQNADAIKLRATKTEVEALDSDLQGQINTANTNVSNLTKRVTTAETGISQNASAIQLRATKTEVEALDADLQGQINTANTNVSNLTKRVTTAETSITQNSDSITSLATRTTANENNLSGVTGRVSTAETKITQNADSITSLASRTSTVENKFGNYSTTTQMNSAIKQSADSISSTVSSTYATKTYVDGQVDAVETRVGNAETSISQNTSAIALRATKTEVTNNISTAINNIKIGGTNMYLDTKNYGGTTPSTSIWNLNASASNTVTIDGSYNGLTVIKVTESWHRRWQGILLSKLKVGESYTMSAWVKNAGGDDAGYPTKIDCYWDTSAGAGSTYTVLSTNFTRGSDAPSVWTRISVTFRVDTITDSTQYCRFRFEPYTSDYTNHKPHLHICGLKLEAGNKATDWSPAPEDIETRVTTAEASITTNAGNIALKASKTELTSAISDIKIGGSNLVLNGDFSQGTVAGSKTAPNNWEFFGTRTLVYSLQGTGNYAKPRTLYIGHDTTDSGIMQAISLEKNTQYTMSFSATKEVVTNLYFNITYYDASNAVLSTTSFNHTSNGTIQSFTFTTPSTFDHAKFIHGATATTYGSSYLTSIGNVKLEKGNKATDWSPASADLVGKTEIVSAINLSPEAIKISSDKIQLEGFVSVNQAFSIDEEGDMIANSGQIGGFDITDGSLECDIVEDFSSITENDINTMKSVILEGKTITDAEFDRLDINGDYHIGATDMLYAKMMTTGTEPKTATSKMSINLNSAKDAILLEGKTGVREGQKTRIGVGGIKTPSIKVDEIHCDTIETNGIALTDQISHAGNSSSWVNGRSNAAIRTTSSDASLYYPILSAKAGSGSWEIGTYTGDYLHFTYITDTDFSNNNNEITTQFTMYPSGGFGISGNFWEGGTALADKYAAKRHYHGYNRVLGWTTLSNAASVNFTVTPLYGLIIVYSYINSDGYFATALDDAMLGQPMTVSIGSSNYGFILSRSGTTYTLKRNGNASVSYVVDVL